MNKKLLYLVFLVTLSLCLPNCTNKDNKNCPTKDAIDLVKAELAAFSNHLPIEGGMGLIITNVNYDDATNTIKYTYKYTVPGIQKPSESQIHEAKQAAVAVIRNQPKEKKLIEQGFIFRYDYYSLDDEYLFTQEISSDDLVYN